jgi:hypothetical protein
MLNDGEWSSAVLTCKTSFSASPWESSCDVNISCEWVIESFLRVNAFFDQKKTRDMGRVASKTVRLNFRPTWLLCTMPTFDIVLILKDAGCIIPDDHSRPITLSEWIYYWIRSWSYDSLLSAAKEPAVFRRSLAKRIGSDPRYSTDDIFQSLQSCLEEESALRQYLMPIVIEQSAIVSRYSVLMSPPYF